MSDPRLADDSYPQRGSASQKTRDFSRGRVRPGSAASNHTVGDGSEKPLNNTMPYSDGGQNPFAKKLSRSEVEACLNRLYGAPVQVKRKANAARETEMTEILDRAIKPAQLALARGRELGKEYIKQKRSKEVATLPRPSSVPLATRPLTPAKNQDEDDTPHIPPNEIELKSAKDFISRFYGERKGRKDKLHDKLARKFLQPMPTVVVDEITVNDSLERLYTKRPDKQKISEAAARKLYGAPPVKKTKTKEETEASVQRLFKDTVQAKEEKLQKAENEWLENRRKKMKIKKVQQHEWDDIAKRLCTPYSR